MFIAIAGILAGIAYVIWHVFHTQLTELVRWVRWGELWVDKFLVGDDHGVTMDDGRTMTVGQWRDWLGDKRTTAADIAPEHIFAMTAVAVPPLRVIFAVVYGLMSLYTIFFGYGSQYRRRMGLEGLIGEQARSFPAISPFVKFDPRKMPQRAPGMPVPAQLPPFAEALSPEEWIAYHEIPYSGGKMDENKAWQALAQQLGRRWEGPLKLPLYAQGIYAACALKQARKRKDSEMLLNDLARAWSIEGGFRPTSKTKSFIIKTIKDPKLGGALQKFTDQHAWENTAMLRALQRARLEGGVMAPAEFLWLRGIDRNLWYPMNNLGRKSFHVEASGALVHFTNELIASQKIPTPRFDDVIKGIEAYMKSTSARGVPPLDKTTSSTQYMKDFKKKSKK